MRHLLSMAVLAFAAVSVGCGGTTRGPAIPTGAGSNLMQAANTKSIYMRASIDADPSAYLGRFIPDTLRIGEIDDGRGVRTQCSEYFQVRRVNGGNVKYDDLVIASQNASLGVQAPIHAAAFGGGSQGAQVMRMRYTLTEKWMVDVRDPSGYANCCRSNAGACTGRVIGEYLGGTGEVLYAVGSKADATGQIAGSGLDIKDQYQWQRSIQFEQPVFFAFRLSDTQRIVPIRKPTDTADWDVNVPEDPTGKREFFVGVSEWMPSERMARNLAMLEVRREVIRYVGESITQSSTLNERYGGAVQNIEASMEEAGKLERASKGVAQFVRALKWKKEESDFPEGRKYKMRVLGQVRKADVEKMAEALARALQGR